ncbi:Leishmanolysin-like peptidase [Hypsibius exemplaris]|uniref:Leishmanolysin-like peptidase n=1 Tax=Hypsibius exemplaris TaxID=2072580 RepID=A0A1W0XE90_HYPEX|nr:Leishmanolysin-like peptidase [Hypsibius exemplaris]
MGTSSLFDLLFVICPFLLVSQAKSIPHSQCSYQPPSRNQVLPPVLLEPHHVLRKRSITDKWKPLRISIFYDNSSLSALPASRQRLIKDVILPKAVKWWSQVLSVIQSQEPIRLHRKCQSTAGGEYKVHYPDPKNTNIFYCDQGCDATSCGEIVVPEEHLLQCMFLKSDDDTDLFSDFFGSPAPAKVKQVSGPPDGPGVKDTDFVLYVSTLETERCNASKTVAYAAHCQQEMTFDRPIAGHANLCPHAISDNPADIATILSTVKHEILHALGFSIALFAFFRDSNGNPLSPRDKYGRPDWDPDHNTYRWSEKTIRQIERPNWEVRGGTVNRPMSMFVTPRVVEETRRHFACNDLEGAELENQGGEGTATTHWEKRVFANEAMTGVHTQNPVYSNMTLALMEDSGWYKPNYTLAGVVQFGAGLGCEFAMKSCKSWIDRGRKKGIQVEPYCDHLKSTPTAKMTKTECSAEKDSLSICNLAGFLTSLQPNYQNFDTIPGVPDNQVARYGGTVELADFCPFMQEFTWKSPSGLARGSRCTNEENQPDSVMNFAMEKYSSRSMCFNQDKPWSEKSCQYTRTWQHWGSGCYEYVCANGQLQILVQNRSVVCYAEGQSLSLQVKGPEWLHTGTIVCPSCVSVCETKPGFKCLPPPVSPTMSILPGNTIWDDLDCSGGDFGPAWADAGK